MDVAAFRSTPRGCIVSPPADAPTLSGEAIRAADVNLTARVISNGQPHRALPLNISFCTAVAARIAGTVAAEAAPPAHADSTLRLGMPSEVLTVGAEVGLDGGRWVARAGSFYRTARRLFDGRVWVPATAG